MLPFGVGVSPSPPWIKDVVRHEQTGLLVYPKKGVIYGKQGQVVGSTCSDGYVRLGQRRQGPTQYLYAHRVIWETVNGPIPAGLYVDHLNGKKADNRIRNLEAVTPAQNSLRALALGLAAIGEERSDSKLTDALVREIRQSKGKVSNAEWARRLGLDRSTIRCAREGKTWRHVPCRGRSKAASRRSSRRPRSRK